MLTERTDVEAETPILLPPDTKSDSSEKTLMLGKSEVRRRRGCRRMRWLVSITNSMDLSLGGIAENCCWIGRLGVMRFMGSQRVRHN